MALCAGWLLLTNLTACADDKPPPLTIDTSCDRFAHISFTEAQIKAVESNYDLWESAVDQVVSHNIEFDKRCKENPK